MNEGSNRHKTIWLWLAILSVLVVVQSLWIWKLSTQLSVLDGRYDGQTNEISDNSVAPVRRATIDDLDAIRALIEKGNYQQALEEHIWFHEASRLSPELGGVRASFALSSWVELSEHYPPARSALLERRDKYSESMNKGEAGYLELSDLFGINLAINDLDAVVADFRKLADDYPESAETMYLLVEPTLRDQQQYDLISQFLAGPKKEFERLRREREDYLVFAEEANGPEKRMYLDLAEDGYIESVVALIKTYVSVGRQEKAREVQNLAMEYHPREKIEQALPSP